ncbi:hypothetical protein B0T22DRAFT_449692 [Podospora appendiculata]|uniref:Rhodopsin domain-containing protein n=1 Tax=Podospora appendiculata TaxID=314037 RepID=A0AAE0XI32_9PEZI|nr:hypothetical protein B0T22DRAFT_449692 [Podospora appendiculata]
MLPGFVHLPVLPIVTAHLAINTIITFLGVGLAALRIIARFKSGANLWWDDYLVLAALPQGLGMLIISGLWSDMGVGYPATETMANILPILKLLISYELIFCTAISTIKLSILFFYLRVFVNQGLRLATKLAMLFVGLWSTGNFLQVFLLCRPFAASYDPRVKGTCGNQIASFIAIGAFNIVTDVLILTLPLPTVWALKMSTGTKIGLTCVFLFGLIVSVISIIRIVVLTQLDLTNLTGTMIWADFWSCMEINLAIICVSLPMLGTLFSRCTSRRGASKLPGPSNSDGYGSNSGSHGFNRIKQRTTGKEDYGLESIYAANQEIHSHSAVVAEPKRSRAPTVSSGTGSGSDVILTGTTPEQPSILEQEEPGVIKVSTKWTISHD